jgi:hypothetical protein
MTSSENANVSIRAKGYDSVLFYFLFLFIYLFFFCDRDWKINDMAVWKSKKLKRTRHRAFNKAATTFFEAQEKTHVPLDVFVYYLTCFCFCCLTLVRFQVDIWCVQGLVSIFGINCQDIGKKQKTIFLFLFLDSLTNLENSLPPPKKREANNK